MTKVFISHGHNETVKLKLRSFLHDRLGLEPVILSEQPDRGLTVIEKLEYYGRNCEFALIVLTADDPTRSGGVRARQNVIHELGVFHGILGRDRVLLLKQAGVELFSNISGLIYKEFEGGNIELVFEDIRRALETGSAQRAGISVPHQPFDASAMADGDLRRLFLSPETTYIVPSYEHSRGRTNVRDSDFRAATAISSLTRTEISDDSLPFSFSHPAFPLVILGSPRYNSFAETLQSAFHLPYQFVESRHSAVPSERRLSVLTEFGEEFVSTQDELSMTDGVEIDYGIFLVAILKTGKKLYWIAGIHSAGTDGVWQYIRDFPDAPELMPLAPGEATTLLIRTRFRPEGEDGKKRATILGVEPLGAPRRFPLRTRTSPAPQAVLCDLGDVLMYFDRTRTYRAIAHYAPSLSWRDIQEKLENDRLKLRERYESGDLDTERFCGELYSVLGLNEQTLPRTLLEEFWGDIFWLNKEMAKALKYLHDVGTHLVLLSNTNPLHFQTVERDYPDLLQYFSARVLSYEEGSAKPHAPIFARAIEVVRSKVPGCPTADMLVVDDTVEHVQAARGLGMKALLYQSYPHFVWWARTQGLYIP